MKKIIIPIVVLLTIISAVSPTRVVASGHDEDCSPVYGNGSPCSKTGVVLVDKKVLNPATGNFVDNLGVDDAHYHPGQVITFQVTVKNTGDEKISQVSLKDIFPIVSDHLVIDFMSGPGSYNADEHTLTFTADDLSPDEERQFEIKGKIRHTAALPTDKVFCPDPGNYVEGTIVGKDMSSSDTARFCIEKEGKPVVQSTIPTVTVTPDTGPRDWMYLLAGLGSAFTAGIYLRSYSKRSL